MPFLRTLAASAAALFALQAAAQATFAPHVPYAAGDAPRVARVADLDGDGDLDVVAINQASSTITVFRNDGTGVLAVQVSHPHGFQPVDLVLADFNNDGLVDLASADASGNVASVRLNFGNADFSNPENGWLTAISPLGIAAGDLNGDGNQDLVVTTSNNILSVLLGNGNGTFAPKVDYATGGSAPQGVVLGDFNGDGRLDVVIAAAGSDTIATLPGNGDGTLGAPLHFAAGDGPAFLAAGDFNGDGNLDVAAANIFNNSISVSPGLGNGGFGAAIPVGVVNLPRLVSAGDFDRDGNLDLAVAVNGVDEVVVFAGNGNGTFAAPSPVAAGDGPFGIAAADMNGDGRLDLVVTNALADTIGVLLNTTAVVPLAPTAVAAAPGNAQLTVAFSPPTDAASLPILDYTATCGAVSVTGPGSPIVVAPLVNGTAYTCTVVARNATGTSTASAPSSASTPISPSSVALATSGTPSLVGANVTFTATVTGDSPAGTVDFKDGGTSIAGCAAVALAGGAAQCTTAFATPGTKAITADYSGNAANLPSSGTLAGGQVVNLATATLALATSGSPSVVGASVTFTATVTGNTPTGTVDFREGGITIAGCGAVALAGGLAQCTTTFLTVGTKAITAGYSGDGLNTTAAGTLAGGQVVVLATSGVALATSASPVAVGASVTFTATVTGNAPTGTVAFRDGGAIIAGCGAVALAAGAAQCTASFVTAGTKAITADYAGDALNAASSGTLAGGQVVLPAQTTFTGPTATGSGNATVSFTGGGPTCGFAPQGAGPLQSAFFIALEGHPKSPPAGSAPAAVVFAHGLLDFVLVNCTPGSTVSFTVTYPGALHPTTQYWKYGPEPGNPTPHWYVLPATIAGNTATFAITDGGLGDDDLAANGTVVDQGGPGTPAGAGAIQTPTLSQWALMLLASLVLAVGTAGARRRSAAR